MVANTHSRVAQPLDDGFHHFAVPLSLRLRIHGRSHQVFIISLAAIGSVLTTDFSWRWTYGIGSIYSAIVVGIIALLGEET